MLDAETHRENRPIQGHSFDELMLLYLDGPSKAKRSPERDRYSLKRLYPVFSGRLLEKLGVADARRYIAERQSQGVQSGTINTEIEEIGLMSAALNWAPRELEWAVPNPFEARRLRQPVSVISIIEGAVFRVFEGRTGWGRSYPPASVLA